MCSYCGCMNSPSGDYCFTDDDYIKCTRCKKDAGDILERELIGKKWYCKKCYQLIKKKKLKTGR